MSTIQGPGMPIGAPIEQPEMVTDLDFSRSTDEITTDGHPWTINDNPLVNRLKETPGVTVVNLSNHHELDNLTISRFRKFLPELSKVILYNVSLDKVDGEQLCKFVANNIELEMDANATEVFHSKALQYLDKDTEHHTNPEKIALSHFRTNLNWDYPNDFSAEEFKKIIKIKDRAFQRRMDQNDLEARQEREEEQKIKQDFLSEWQSGVEKFRHGNKWEEGPKSVNDWPNITMYTMDFREELHIMYAAITELQLWDAMRDEPDEGGFTFSSKPHVNDITSHKAVVASGHTGYTEGNALSMMQDIANNGWEAFCNKHSETKLNPIGDFLRVNGIDPQNDNDTYAQLDVDVAEVKVDNDKPEISQFIQDRTERFIRSIL